MCVRSGHPILLRIPEDLPISGEMVCKGLRNDEEVPKSCDTDSTAFYGSSVFHGMANACFGRWGRSRKQANPKRTNHREYNIEMTPFIRFT